MKKILIMLVILPAFFGCAWAEEIDGQALEIFESGKMEQGLNEKELAIIGGIEPEQFDAFPALSRLWNAFLTEIQNRLRENLGFAAELFGLILFSALAAAATRKYARRSRSSRSVSRLSSWLGMWTALFLKHWRRSIGCRIIPAPRFP